MKKILVSMFLLVLGLSLAGCETVVKTTTLASIVKEETFNDASVTSLRSEYPYELVYDELKEQTFYKNIMNSKIEFIDKLPNEIPFWSLEIKSDSNKLQIHSLIKLYAEYNGKIYLIDCSNEDKSLLNSYLLGHNRPTYKLTIQNQTDYELIGIKNEYKAGEEVEVKMIYEDDVVTYVHLNGKNIGWLNGINSLKFNMPNEDSVLTINYSEEFITVIHPEFINHFLIGFNPDSVILSDGEGTASINKSYADFKSQSFFDEFSKIEVTMIEDNDDYQMPGIDYYITFINSFDDSVSLQFYGVNDLDSDKVTTVYYGRLKCFSNPSINYQFAINKDMFYEIINYFFDDAELTELFYSLQESFENGFLTYEDLQQIANLNNNGPFNPVEINQDIAILIMKDFCKMHNVDYEENGGSVRCFGEYNGYYAVMVDGCGFEYLTAMDSEVAGGITFIYGSSQHILIWKYHK